MPPTNQSPTGDGIAEKISDAVIKVLIGSSGFVSLYQLIQDDIPSALIALGITVGATLLTSFGQGIMEQLNPWAKERGKKIGSEITDSAESAIFKWSGIDRKYLEALRIYCYALEVEGLKASLPSLALKDVFIQLRLEAQSTFTIGETSAKEIWDLLPRKIDSSEINSQRRIAIVANPGYGKTTLTRYLTLSYIDNTHQEHESKSLKDLLPIWIPLRSCFKDIQDERTPTLSEFILSYIENNIPGCRDLTISAHWLKKQLQDGNCLVMFDGLDEVPEQHRQVVSRWINWYMQAYPSQFILTSRPHGYDENLFRGVQKIGIYDFNSDQKEKFVFKWYETVLWQQKWLPHWEKSQRNGKSLLKSQVQEQSNAEAKKASEHLIRQITEVADLNEISKNPLIITLIAATHKAYSSLPTRRVQIYKKIFSHLLEDRPSVRETHLTIPTAEDNQVILQQLAYYLFRRQETQFTLNPEINQFLYGKLKDQLTDDDTSSLPSPKRYLWEIENIAGLLIGGSSNLYEFTHKTFQEFLVAAECKRLKDGESILLNQFRDDAWMNSQEVIRFYVAMTHATPFVEAILEAVDISSYKFNPNNDGLLLLAYSMVFEDKSRIAPDIKLQLVQALENTELGTVNHKIKLRQHFEKRSESNAEGLVPLQKEGKVLLSDYITWGEYKLFIQHQKIDDFHSQAQDYKINISPKQQTFPISWSDAQWFCAWLSTQTYIHTDNRLWHYRLPQKNELGKVRAHDLSSQERQPFLISSRASGNALRVVRERIPDDYRALITSLAGGRWQVADQETEDLMLKISARQTDGKFTIDSIKEFPDKHLDLINHLWLKFSGDRFGFSTQRKLWLEEKGKLDFGEDRESTRSTFRRLCERNGWRTNGRMLDYKDLNFDFSTAPIGHLPTLYKGCNLTSGIGTKGIALGWNCLLSRLENCNLRLSRLSSKP